METKASIIIASYNKADHIAETIASVIAQSYGNWELLIVDDASTDASVSTARSFKDNRITVIENTVNRGANYCRNEGIRRSQGNYILFLDADDVLAPECIKKRLAAAQQHPDADMLIFSMGVFYKTPGDDARRWNPVSKQPLKDFLQHNLPWSILQPLWKKEFLLKLNGFDENFQRLQDVELNTRALLSKGATIKQLPGDADCYYRIDEQRKNYAPAIFLKRWVQSAVQYCDKFYHEVASNNKRHLLGTLYQTYMALLLAFKSSQITYAQLNELENILLRTPLLMKRSNKTYLFNIARRYNLLSWRIPGVNYLIKSILISNFKT